jgi:hypothetical protein
MAKDFWEGAGRGFFRGMVTPDTGIIGKRNRGRAWSGPKPPVPLTGKFTKESSK